MSFIYVFDDVPYEEKLAVARKVATALGVRVKEYCPPGYAKSLLVLGHRVYLYSGTCWEGSAEITLDKLV